MAPRTRIAAAVALVCAISLLHVPGAAATECAGEETMAGEQATEQLEQSLLCLINERRRDAGVSPVRGNERLAQAASQHANAMVAGGFFSHTAPGGETFIDRISDSGYMRGARTWMVGENLVWGSGELSTPASMVQAWMESPPHRANLLRERFREVGIAAARGTPSEAANVGGITVSSEYGFRVTKKRPARKARKARRARGSRR